MATISATGKPLAKKNIAVIYEESRRGYQNDNRRFGAWLVISYLTDSGMEYRRSFWAAANTPMQWIFDSAPATIEVPEEI